MGVVFDIQKMSLHDGPGIRTTVFLKGCPLRCKWCHNPESYYKNIQLQYHADKCIGCGICLTVCPNHVHALSKFHTVDFSACQQCGLCIESCPSKAMGFFGREWSVEAVLDFVEEDKVLFEDGGGVTFSGGEATYQKSFLKQLLIGSKDRGLNTCVDTCGYTSWETLLEILPYTDVFLYDLKSFSEAVHIEATGVSNVLIKNNLEKLSECGANIYVRIPLVKEFNTAIDEIEKMALFLSHMKIKGVTLMPYHVLGYSKRNMIGLEGDIYTAPSDEEMAQIKKIFEWFRLKII